MKRADALRIVLAVILLAAVVAALFIAQIPHSLGSALEAIQGGGVWAFVLVVALYLPVCLLLLPSTPLNLASGFLFGMLWGIGVASLASILSAAVAFLLGRFLLREWLERRLAAQPGFQAADMAFGEQGLKIVLLVRLCTLLPFGLTSYAFGTTRVSLGRFTLGTLFGRLPQVVFCAYLGSTARSLAELATGRTETSIGEQILLGLGFFATLAVVILMTRIARKALRETVGRTTQSDEESGRRPA